MTSGKDWAFYIFLTYRLSGNSSYFYYYSFGAYKIFIYSLFSGVWKFAIKLLYSTFYDDVLSYIAYKLFILSVFCLYISYLANN